MERFEYIRSFIKRDSEFLMPLEVSSIGRDDIQPSVEAELGKFLGLMVRLTNAKKVLEIGSGIGYSTIWLGEAVRATSGKVVTLDNHERTHKELVKNIKDAGLDLWIEARLGDAKVLVDEMEDEWDIVFQDGGKYLYPVLQDKLVDITRAGGLIIADDTLFKVDSSIRKGLGRHVDEYNRMVFADKRLYSTILPVGHGITISLKKV